jgi:hypothetical protein
MGFIEGKGHDYGFSPSFTWRGIWLFARAFGCSIELAIGFEQTLYIN